MGGGAAGSSCPVLGTPQPCPGHLGHHWPVLGFWGVTGQTPARAASLQDILGGVDVHLQTQHSKSHELV